MVNHLLSLSKIMISQKQAIHIEESIIVEEAKATHDPNGELDVNASFVLNFVENIINFKTVPRKAIQDMLKLQEHIQKEISSQVLQLSFEIACNCLNNDDSHSTAIYLLNSLSKYPWQVKVVMMLASFAIICGKFKVVSQSCQRKGLAYNLTLLKQSLKLLPSSSDNEELINESIKSVLGLTKHMVEFRHSSSVISASYWIARSVVSYASYFAHLHIFGLLSQNQLMEQSLLCTKIKEILTTSLPLLEAKGAEINYEALLHKFQNSSHIIEVLKLIFNVKDDNDKPILDRSNNPIGLDRFQNKGLLLLVASGIHYPWYVYFVPTEVEMIWVPIIENPDTEEHIEINYWDYSCYYRVDPYRWVSPEFKNFLKKKCFPTFQVGGYPIIISLDKRGRLVHTNAFHMIITWRYDLFVDRAMEIHRQRPIIPSLEEELRERTLGADRVIGDIDKQIYDFARKVRNMINYWVGNIESNIKSSIHSYNYTSEREQAMWDKESWSLKLLMFENLDTLNDWIAKEQYIFLCGGNNMKRVQEFVLKVQEVCSKTQMNLKIAHIGKMARNKVYSEVNNKCDFKLGYRRDFWRFWTRLQSIALSRIQYLVKVGHDERRDEIMQGLKKLLAYEAEGTTVGSWALLSKGNKIVVCDLGDKMLRVINEYEKWKDNADANGFEQAFKDCYDMFISCPSPSDQHPCCALNYPSNLDRVPETVSCPQCNRNMHKFVTFSCNHGPPCYFNPY